MEIVATHAPAASRIGAAIQATEKADSPAAMAYPVSNALRAAPASVAASVTALPVGEGLAVS